MPEDPSSSEERIDVAYGAVKQLLLAINLGGDDLPDPFAAFIDKAVRMTLAQHGNHLICHGVNQTHVDPYKVVCWLGCSILADLPCVKTDSTGQSPCAFRVVAKALIRTLCGMLKYETEGRVEIPLHTRKLLQQMLIAERTENNDHGIWQNGLYAAFHFAITTYKVLTSEPPPTDVDGDSR